MGRIEEHKYSITEAFQECYYIVPDYQREYIWTDKQVRQLLDDINDEMDGSKKEYFIGTILVSPIKNNKNHYEIIDGQQRLTTLFLLLSALKHMFTGEPLYPIISSLISNSYANNAGDVVTTLRLDPKYENASALMKTLVDVNTDPDTTRTAIQAAGIPSFGSLENLLDAYKTVFRYLEENYKDLSQLKAYFGYLTNDVVFIQISTEVSSALKIFETINERGIGLNPMDLLKNLLFTHVKQDEFTRLKENWKKITAPLEKNKEKPLRFLRYYLMANYKIENKRSDNTVQEGEIYEWFTDKKNAALCQYQAKPFEFVNHVIKNVEQFINFSKGNGNDGEYNIPMRNLKRLCGGAFSLHYILLLAARNLPKHLFDHFVAQLESFLYYYIFTKSPTKELERNFSLWADELRKICHETDPLKQLQQYNLFLKDKLMPSMTAKSAELTDSLKRYSLNSMQQYRTHYLLAKITQHVDMAYKGIKMVGSIEEYGDLQVEHIMPNTPNSDLRNEFIINNPGLDYDEFKNHLGNLTLLERPINIVAGNGFFINKCEEYKKSKNYLTSSIAELKVVGNNTSINRMNQMLKAFNVWNATTINERQSILINLAKEVWKIGEYV